MSDYIRIVSKKSANGGYSFMTSASFRLDNITVPFSNVDVKIDLGCSLTTIPIQCFWQFRLSSTRLKKQDLENGVKHIRSFGVETGGRHHPKAKTFEEKMKDPSLKFLHSVYDFSLAGIPIPQDTIYINYDRSGNILIGADTLSYLESHIGISRESGEYVFLSRLPDEESEGYAEALKKDFAMESYSAA